MQCQMTHFVVKAAAVPGGKSGVIDRRRGPLQVLVDMHRSVSWEGQPIKDERGRSLIGRKTGLAGGSCLKRSSVSGEPQIA